MSHGTRSRPFGFWILGSTIDPAELEAFDASQFVAINGDAGGTWAPSTPIILGGANPLNIAGPMHVLTGGGSIVVDVGGTAIFSGSAEFGGTVAIDGPTEFSNDVLFDDTSTVTLAGTTTVPALAAFHTAISSDMVVNGTAEFHGATLFTATNAFTGAVAMSGTTTLTGATSLDGANTVTGPTTISGAAIISGASLGISATTTVSSPVVRAGSAATMTERLTVLGATTPQNIDTSADYWEIPTNLGANSVFNIQPGPAGSGYGRTITISRGPFGAHSAQLVDGAAGSQISSATIPANTPFFVKLVWAPSTPGLPGDGWHLMGWDRNYAEATGIHGPVSTFGGSGF